MRALTIRVVLVSIGLFGVPAADAFSIAYYTTIRNDTDRPIEIKRDLKYSRKIYMIAPRTSLTFLGGLSTVGFSVRTADRILYYKFPLSPGPEPFGAEATLHNGRQNHSYVFLPDHKIYPLSPTGAILRESHGGFPIAPSSKDLTNR
jgi:hypothetical protein